MDKHPFSPGHCGMVLNNTWLFVDADVDAELPGFAIKSSTCLIFPMSRSVGWDKKSKYDLESCFTLFSLYHLKFLWLTFKQQGVCVHIDFANTKE